MDVRAAFLEAVGDLRVEDVALPALAPDMVRLRVLSCGICGTNINMWRYSGPPPGAPREPGAYGHEVAGEVIAVGAQVTTVRPGDRVAVELFENRACTRCRYCHQGLFWHCQQQRPVRGSGFIDELILYDRGLYPLPAGMSAAEGSLVEPFSCSLHALRLAGLAGGESICVLGAGVLGLFAVAGAKHLGAGRVICTAKYPAQAELARRLGADVVLDSTDPEVNQRIQAAAGAPGPDVVVETVGGKTQTLQQGCAVVRPAGKVMVLGLFEEPVPVDTVQAVYKELSIIFPATYSVINRRHEYELALELMASGKVPGKDLITHSFGLADIQHAFEVAADKTRGSVRVNIEPPLG
jgi:threonine dehydrogenase-like Zn-dependent dehydrogenase